MKEATLATDPDFRQGSVELASARLRLSVLPQVGASVIRLDWHNDEEWVPLLQPARPGVIGDPTKSSLFCMLPWCDRLSATGVQTIDGLLAIAPNWPTTPLPVHGIGWLSDWTPTARTPHSVTLAHRHDMQEGYRYGAELVIALAPNSISLRLAVTNLGQRSLPFGLGFHPYFPRLPYTRLTIAATRQTHLDEMGLPASSGEVTKEGGFTSPRPLPTETLSVVYDARTAAISQPQLGYRLHLLPDATLQRQHLWAPAGMPFFCVEPLSHDIDAFSHPRKAAQHFLPSGHCMQAGVKFVVEPISLIRH